MGRTCYSYGRTEPNKTGTRCCGRRKKTKGQTETKMGRWCDGRCQEAGGEKLEECRQEQGQLAEASEEGLGSKGAVVPMMMMISTNFLIRCIFQTNSLLNTTHLTNIRAPTCFGIQVQFSGCYYNKRVTSSLLVLMLQPPQLSSYRVRSLWHLG